MQNEIEIFYSLQRRINTVRLGIMEVARAINATRKWCRESQKEWDKQSEDERKRLEELSISIFESISKADDELRETKITVFNGMTSVISERWDNNKE